MESLSSSLMLLDTEQCQRAAETRDPRFDGVFFIGIVSTRIYCRPICPARVSIASNRRFFVSAAAAERAGFRPCLRCRPELAPGRAPVDAVARLAFAAATRIAAGALNGRSVDDLARELRVSSRHLRRALEREAGVSPVELAQTHRLLLAKRLLADTTLPVTEIAFASGYQSLRRFNAAFRQRYRLAPTALRRGRPRRVSGKATADPAADPFRDFVRLTLAYRAPFDWQSMLRCLDRSALPGVEIAHGHRYGRTVALDGRRGIVFVSGAARPTQAESAAPHLELRVSLSLLPALMPLLARLRQLFDLDADPVAIDAQLAAGGLGSLVAARPGLRLPGALDGFEVAFATLLGGAAHGDPALSGRVTQALGEPFETGFASLRFLAPTAARVAATGVAALLALRVPARTARAIAAVADAVLGGQLVLEPGGSVQETLRTLADLGVTARDAAQIVMRTLIWPDSFCANDRALQAAAGARGEGSLRRLAERWQPWRAYAALHLGFSAERDFRRSDLQGDRSDSVSDTGQRAS